MVRAARFVSLVAALPLVLLLLSSTRAEAGYASIVIDAENGAVLQETAADQQNFPASLTKMMTLYLTFEALRDGRIGRDDRLPVSAAAASMSPTKLGLRAGQAIKVEDAIKGLITESANDAAVVLAEAMGGSEAGFARKMTVTARRLGMLRTNFANASGLPNPNNISTARDLATLGLALIRDFPDFYPMFATRSFAYGGLTHANHNKLLGQGGVDGIKTGYIRASGFNLAASAVRDGRRLVAVVMGGTSPGWRNARMAQLLDAAFQSGKPHETLLLADAKTAETLASASRRRFLATKASNPSAPLPTATSLSVASETSRARGARGGDWAVQVGAFASDRAAKQAAAKARREAHKYLASGQILIDDSGDRYRARIGGLNRKSAQAACAALKKRGRSCLIVAAN